MKKIIFTIVLAVTATGCYGAQLQELNDRTSHLERENESLRQKNAQLRNGQGDESAQPLVDVPTAQAAAPTAQTRQARAWVERQHGAYLCFADYDRHLSQAPRFKFRNRADRKKQRRNSFLALTFNGQPVIVVSANSRSFFLRPDQSCWMEKGGADEYVIRAKLYRNVGGSSVPVLDREPDGQLDPYVHSTFEGTYPLHRDEVPFVFQTRHFSR